MFQALSNIGKYTKKTIEYRYLELFFGENLLTSDGKILYVYTYVFMFVFVSVYNLTIHNKYILLSW